MIIYVEIYVNIIKASSVSIHQTLVPTFTPWHSNEWSSIKLFEHLPSWELTYPPFKGMFKSMMFLFRS